MVIKRFYFIVSVLFLLASNNLYASRILDHETEVFIEKIINDIKFVNNINRKIEFKIISNKNINAYVDQNNIIYITSGLIENCQDYVALLSVIAHEIGHIDKNHISKRNIKINKLKNINKISNLSIIAGSLISNNPKTLQGIALSSAGISEVNIKFNKNQEREADYYSLETLKKLNLYSLSIIELLKTIEIKSKERGLTKDKLKISSHPYFEERIEIINYLAGENSSNFDKKLDKKFKFIQAKFIGYSGNSNLANKLYSPYKLYSYSILKAKLGDLKESLKQLNKLILLDKKNIYLIETKADILFSFGYINEALKFYTQVINKKPNNYYAQIRVFENTDIDKLSKYQKKQLFIKNLNLLNNFYNNRNILLTYLNLADKIEKDEWVFFLNYWLNKKDDKEIIKKNLFKFRETNDKDLYNLIEIIRGNLK